MSSERVDRENKIIRGYSVMSLGEAAGHGMVVDETTLDQVVALGNAASGGVKTRIQHPNSVSDGFGRLVGKSTNFRREGNKAVADLQLSPMAFSSPNGDLGTYLLDLAENDPDTFGASPEVQVFRSPVASGLPAMRLRKFSAVAIVDNPATNAGFFTCLSIGEPDMADTALESKVTELSAERDLLAEEVARLKASVATLESQVTAKSAELSVAKADAAAAAVKDERARIGDVIALCSKAGKSDLSAKYITDGTPTATVQAALFDVLCSTNKPIGEGEADLNAKPDENAAYKSEYKANAYLSSRMTEDEYIATRRIDDGISPLVALKVA